MAIRLCVDQWAAQKVVLYRDNQVVVSVLTNGRTKDRTLAAIAINIHMQLALRNINLHFIRILSKNNNIASLLSRWDITPDNLKKLHSLLPSFQFISVPNNMLACLYNFLGPPPVSFPWRPELLNGSTMASKDH